MESDSPKPKCYHCGKPGYWPQRDGTYFCIECNLILQHTWRVYLSDSARFQNYLAEVMESSVGLPGYHQPRVPVFEEGSGGMTLANFNISDSNIGVLNSGTARNIDVNMTLMRSHGESILADALAEFTEKAMESDELNSDVKAKIAEQLEVVTAEIAKPEESRRKTIIESSISYLGTLLSAASLLQQNWESIRQLLQGLV